MKRKDENSTRDAIKAKRSQLLNNQLAKEAIEIQKQYTKATQGRDSLFGNSLILIKKSRKQEI